MNLHVICDTTLNCDSWSETLFSIIHGYADVNHELLKNSKVIYHKNEQSVVDLLNQGKINQRDKVLFTDASSSLVPRIYDVFRRNGKKGYFYGIWRDESFTTDPLKDEMNRKDVAISTYKQHLLKFNYHLLTRSLFLSSYQFDKFKELIPKSKKHKTSRVTGYPLEGLIADLEYRKENAYKTNSAVMPFVVSGTDYTSIMYSLKKELPEIDFTYPGQISFDDETFYSKLTNSKILFYPIREEETFPINIFSALALNCIPLVPDFDIYKRYLPEEFLYPKSLTSDIVSYAAQPFLLKNKMQDVIQNYETYKKLAEETYLRLSIREFNSSRLMDILFENYTYMSYIKAKRDKRRKYLNEQ